jgi:hypothetical protein
VERQVVLNESESSRVNYVADTLGIARDDLRIKVCQLKSFLANKRRETLELKATMAQNVTENFSQASSFMKLVYGVSGIISIAFAVEVATGAVAAALLLIGLFLLFVGLAELKRLLKQAWDRFSGKLDTVFA